MFDPSTLTLGQVSSAIRDFSIVLALIAVVWKARGIFEDVSNFFTRVIKHMDSMENFARTVMDNHLLHIEQDLKTLSGRQDDTSIVRNTFGERSGFYAAANVPEDSATRQV